MVKSFCEHLKDYEELYECAAAAGALCNERVASALASDNDAEAMDQVAESIEAWLTADRSLREALVDLVKSGDVKIPKKKPGRKKRGGSPRCGQCGFRIPCLRNREWEFAGNGVAAFRGEEFLPVEPVEAR